MDHVNNERDLGRLEGKMDSVQKSVDEVRGSVKTVSDKLDHLSTSHYTLLAIFNEQTTQKNKWKDPALAALSGGSMSLLVGWVMGLFKH